MCSVTSVTLLIRLFLPPEQLCLWDMTGFFFFSLPHNYIQLHMNMMCLGLGKRKTQPPDSTSFEDIRTTFALDLMRNERCWPLLQSKWPDIIKRNRTIANSTRFSGVCECFGCAVIFHCVTINRLHPTVCCQAEGSEWRPKDKTVESCGSWY